MNTKRHPLLPPSSDRKAYNLAYRLLKPRKLKLLCECGQKATLFSDGYSICARCAALESVTHADYNRVGIRGGGGVPSVVEPFRIHLKTF